MTQKTFFLAGHATLQNRGCEALVRSIAGMVRERYPDAIIFAPSESHECDQLQWPDAYESGIRFLPAAKFPLTLRVWNRARRLLPVLERLGRPTYALPQSHLQAIRACDALLMIGGDNISLDYGVASLYFHARYVDVAKSLGKRTALWAASVGPFSELPHVERLMVRHLRSYDVLSVRESKSEAYLKALDVPRVVSAADPAFLLEPQPSELGWSLPSGDHGVVGLNVSSLVRGYVAKDHAKNAFDEEIQAFIRKLRDSGYGVLLIPHVDEAGRHGSGDFAYMRRLAEEGDLLGPQVRMAPANLNARQLKALISRMRFFIGARTHATIAAFSTFVPTISIAYSVKAYGLNGDLFGDHRYVIPVRDVTCAALWQKFTALKTDEQRVREDLRERVPALRQKARNPLLTLVEFLER